MNKTILSMTLAIAAGMFFGCGNSNKTQSEEQTDSLAVEETTAEESVETIPDSLIICLVNSGEITAKAELIDEMEVLPEYPDVFVEKNREKVTVDGAEFEIVGSVHEGWENEGCEFNLLEILCEGKSLLKLRDDTGWVRFNNAGRFNNPYLSYDPDEKDELNPDALMAFPVKISDKATAMLFTGTIYGGEVPHLLIIVLKDKQAKVVFNQDWVIDGLEQRDGQATLKVLKYFSEINGDGTLTTPPARAFIIGNGKIWWSDIKKRN